MVFQNIFGTATQVSGAGTTAGDAIAGYLPTQPGEATCIPPHDPSQPPPGDPRDPKIVRETAPQAEGVFTLVTGLIGVIAHAAGRQNTINADPATTVDAAGPIMTDADHTTRPTAEKIPSLNE